MIIDTDVIIRYLTNDDPQKSERFILFLRSGQKVQLTDVTFAEVYWTARSFYKMKKPVALSMLEALINQSSIMSNKALLSQTMEILRQHTVSFIDAYTAAAASLSDKTVLSFDHDFDKIPVIKRIEP